MKKRCTNSACRRVFSRVLPACPHCGRVYARQRLYLVELTGFQGEWKLAALKALRAAFGQGLGEAKNTLENLHLHPVVLGPMSAEEAQAASRQWTAQHLTARVVLMTALPRASSSAPGWELHLTGCLPGGRTGAEQELCRRLPQAQAQAVLDALPGQSHLLAEHLSYPDAQRMAQRLLRMKALTTDIRWKWAKSEPPDRH